MKPLLPILALICLTACVVPDGDPPPSWADRSRAALDSWIGAPESDLIRAAGAPDRTFQTGDLRVLVYDRGSTTTGQRTAYLQNDYTGTTYAFQSPARTIHHTVQFLVNSNSIIEQWTAR